MSFISFISDAASHPASHTTTTTFAEPTLPRALGPGLFFVIVSSESPPSVRHPRPVYVYVPRPPHTPPSGSLLLAPLTSFSFFFLLLLRCFLMPFHFVFPHYGGFSLPLPSPSGSAPPRRVRVTQTVYISLINLPFSSSHLSVFLSATNPVRTSKSTHDPCIFIRHSPSTTTIFRLFHLIFPIFPFIPSAHHISYILFLLFFFSFSSASM